MNDIIEIIDAQDGRTSLEHKIAEQEGVINLIVGQIERMQATFEGLRDAAEIMVQQQARR